jgi:hypothetical protein
VKGLKRELLFRAALAEKFTSPAERMSAPGAKIALAVRALIAGGLCTLNGGQLRLTDAGRVVLRTCCEHRASVDANGTCIACGTDTSSN